MISKELRRFYNRRHYLQNRQARCDYQRQRRALNPEAVKAEERRNYQRHRLVFLERKKRYYQQHKAAKRVYNRRYYSENIKAVSLKHKEWRRANHAYIIQQNARYLKANPEKRRRYAKAWRTKYPEKRQANDARRRARELAAITNKEQVEWFFRVIRNQDIVTCTYCGKRMAGLNACVDHIIPISRGGVDLPDNYAVACKSCNSSKSDSFLHEWKHCPELFKTLAI